MSDTYDPRLRAWVPTPGPPPQRLSGNATDHWDRFDAADHRAHGDRVRELERQGAFRDHQPGLPVEAMSGAQPAPQRILTLDGHVARMRERLAVETRPGARAEYQEMIATLQSDGFSTLDRTRPIDQRTVVFDADEYAAEEQRWNAQHTAVGTPEREPMDLGIATLAAALLRSRKTICRMERSGILPRAARSPGGNARVYTEAQIEGLGHAAESSGLLATGHPSPAQLEDFSRRAHKLYQEHDKGNGGPP
jgi:hypothetical protein